MPWIGTMIPIPGLLGGFVGVIDKIRDFATPHTVSDMTIRVNDAPSGGSVTVRLHDQADGLGSFLEAIIADGTKIASVAGALALTNGVWQEIEAESGSAMSFSGEYELTSSSGVIDFFTTLAKVKLDGKITSADANRDLVLNSLIGSVTGEMQRWMGRRIVQGTATDEKIDGHGGDTIYTRSYPIIAITALAESDAVLVEDSDFEIEEQDKEAGAIVRISGSTPTIWPSGRRNIKTTYDHGFVSVPPDICQAATSAVLWRFADTIQSGQSRRGLDSSGVDPATSVSYDKDLWQREVVPVMKRYRRMNA